MSLESTVATLVTAANNLTAAVNGKLVEIDGAVDKAVEGVPSEIRKQMSRTVYVDQVNGSDSNDGFSRSAPLKTLKRAADLTPAGASIHIFLLSNCEFDEAGNAEFTGSQVFIQSDDTNDVKTIKFHGLAQDGYYTAYGFMAYRNTLFNVQYVNLELPDVPAGSASPDFRACVFRTHAGADIPTPLSLRFNNVDIIVPEGANNPFCLSTGSGLVMLSASTVTAPSDWVNAGKMFTNSYIINQSVKARLVHDASELLPAS